MPDSLFLDPDKHPYLVVGRKGGCVARFSNLPCAVRTVAGRKVLSRHGGKVLTPEGHVMDAVECVSAVSKDRWWLDLSKAQSTGLVREQEQAIA